MSYDPRNDPRMSLEGISRQAADELIETIVREAKSSRALLMGEPKPEPAPAL